MPRINVLQTEDKKPTQTNTTQNTKTQTVTVGGRTLSTSQQNSSVVKAPQAQTKTKVVQPSNVSNVSVGGRQLTNKQIASTPAISNFVNKAKTTLSRETPTRTSQKNAYTKSYTEEDYNFLKSSAIEMAEDPTYKAMWENVEYKDLWSKQDQADFENRNNALDRVTTEATIAKGDVATQKQIEDTKKDFLPEDVIEYDKDGNGSWKTYDTELATLNGELAELEKQNSNLDNLLKVAGANPAAKAEYDGYKAQSDVVKNRMDEIRESIKAIGDKQAYQKALIDRMNFEYLRENGTQDEFLQQAKYSGAYMNNLLDDIALNVEASQFRKLAGVQTFLENMQKDFSNDEAKRASEIVTKLYTNGEISEAERNEVLGYAQKIVEKNATPGESLGVQLNEIANQLTEMQVNGETATEKLVVNVVGNIIDNSVGQLGPAIALGRAGMYASTALMSFSGYTSTYQQDIAEGYTHEQAKMDALFQSGIEFLTELIGGERILRFAEGDIVPRSIAQLAKEGLKSGLAEATEEGLGWSLSPIAKLMATGEIPNIESWNPDELKEAVTTAFLAGFLQAEMSADITQLGTQAPLTSNEQIISNFLHIETYEGKKRVQDFISELDNMRPDASVRKNIMLPDGTKISERRYIDMVENVARRSIAEYEAKAQVKGVEFIERDRVNSVANLAEDARYSLKDCMEVSRLKQIDSLYESMNAGQTIQTLNEKISEETQKRIVAENSERLAQIQEGLAKQNINVKATDWEQLSNVAKNNATIVSKLSEVIGGTPVEFADLRTKDGRAVDGFYLDGRVVVNPNADLGAISTLVHEYTHGIESSKFYKALSDQVKALYGRDYQKILEAVKDNYSEIKKLSTKEAERELTANTVQKMFGNLDFVKRLVKYNTDMAYKMYTDLKAMSTYSTIAEEMAQNFMRGFTETNLSDSQVSSIVKSQELQGTPAYSIGSVFQAVGMDIAKKANNVIAFKGENQVKNVSIDDVKNSPLGRMMEMSVKKEFISEEEADNQMQMYADVCNLMLNTNDPDLVWAISGSLGYQVANDDTVIDETQSTKSSAFTSNADKQYKRTFDVTTICNKTQQVIDVMSKTMLKLGRGLTENEIVEIVYDEVNKANEPVPCPVCYVFARWVGVGGLLNNISEYQTEYANADLSRIRNVLDDLSGQIDEIAEREGYGKKKTKARDRLSKELTLEYNNLNSQKRLAELNGDEFSEADQARLDVLDEYIKTLDRWTWLKDVRLSKNYKPVPASVLFDLNKGEQFANEYPETWKFRTTRGPAMGKAITPYTSEVLGQTVLGFATKDMKGLGSMRGSKNPFLKPNATKQLSQKYNSAIKNARAQNLLGGSRAQSTSDFRFEYVLDYLLHFMQLQSINSYGQTYTKVPEAVAMLASVNYEVNMSLMPKGYGWEEVQEGADDAIMLSDGKWYHLICSDVTGMNAKDAFRLAKTYDNAQPIMVGINDTHIRLCMKDDRITFIIPYHASGASEGRYLTMMKEVGERVPGDARTDYSTVQNDTLIENATPEQKTLRKIREAILTGKAGSLTTQEMEAMRGHALLNSLYERFYTEGVDEECFGSFLNKEQASQIFPFEYWDKTTTIDTADKNGEAFVQYCDDLGIIPRFAQFKDESGYWKTLIDRSMYNNDGTYHVQKAINLDKFNTDFLFKDKMVEGIVQPSRQMDRTKTDEITENVLSRIDSEPEFSFVSDKAINKIQEYAIKNEGARILAESLIERRNTAKYMLENGATNSEIYSATKMYFGKDGKIRVEAIDDVETIEKNFPKSAGEELKLIDIYGGDGLLTIYPELRDISVRTINDPKKSRGTYKGKENTIVLNLAKSADAGTLIHEVQHAIQKIEGIDRGTNNIYEMVNLWPEVLKDALNGRFDFEKIKSMFNPESKYIKGRYTFNTGEIEARDASEHSLGINKWQEPALINPNVEKEIQKYYPDGRGNTYAKKMDNQDSGEVSNEDRGLVSGEEGDRRVELTPEQAEDNALTVADDALPLKKKVDNAKNVTAKILKDMPKAETASEKFQRNKEIFKRQVIDHFYPLRELGREWKNKKIIAYADNTLFAPGMASRAIMEGVREVGTRNSKTMSKSLVEAFTMSPEAREHFDEYMYHYRNIDTSTQGDRLGGDYKNKYVFGNPDVDAKVSQEIVNELDQKYPELKEHAEMMWEIGRALLKLQVKNGVISQQQYDNFQKATPHYVPIVRNIDGGTGVMALDPNKAIKKFKGSTIDMAPLEHAMIKLFQNTYSAITKNQLHNEIINTISGINESGVIEDATSLPLADDLDGNAQGMFNRGYNPLGEDPNGKKMFAYKDGKKITVPIDDELYMALSPRQNPLGLNDSTVLTSISNIRRNLITGWNPLFAVTNAVKDIQEAYFNTKFSWPEYTRSYLEAWGQIFSKGELYQLYMTNGGGQNSYINELNVEQWQGNTNAWKSFKKAMGAISKVNDVIETLPRLAEFIASIHDGQSVQEAMYNSAEVTTNFKQGGDLTKYLNRNGFTFLNASVVGFDKQMRNLKDAKDAGVKGMLAYMARATLTAGIPLFILNNLMWDDDDDYKELSDYIKSNYYCVKKLDDGKFVRIPKGRVSAFYQEFMQSGIDTLKGKKQLWEALLDSATSLMDNIAPNNPLDNNLISPLWQAFTNKAWYGDQIVSDSLLKRINSEQYDESTDALSIAIGKLSKQVADATGVKILELSPKKINYVLDQYSGAIGDVGLPMITLKTDVAIDNPVAKGFGSAFLDKFTTDSVLKNQNVNDFYSLKEETDKLAISENATDEQKLASKYFGTVGSDMGRLYAEMHTIQADPSMSNKEKMEAYREIKKQINEIAKTALANYDQQDITGRFAKVGGVEFYKNDEGEWVKPSKSSLQKLNEAGISGEDKGKYYETYSKISDVRDTIKSQTPEGKTADYRQATIDAINNSGMSDKGKNTMFDSYYSSKAVDHINKMELTDKQKYDLKVANKMADGEKDANGKTISNSKARATAEAYKKLGLLEDVLKYIKDNDVAPSELGLSKTVYKELTGGASYSTAYAKSMSKKPSSKSSKKTSTAKPKAIKAGGSTGKKQAILTNPAKNTLNSYLNAYSSVFRGSTAKGSTGNATVTCPRCHNQVSSATGRCPICGANL